MRGSDSVGGRLAIGLVACLAASLACAEEPIVVEPALLTLAESVDAPAPESGLLVAFSATEGQAVTEGEVLGRVDARAEQLAAAVAREDLRVARREAGTDVRVRLAEKEHRVAEAELARAESVNAALPNTVSAKEVDRLRLALEKTELAIESARLDRELAELRLGRLAAELRLAEHRAERLQIAAPTGGVVVERYKHAGEWVDRGERVARIVRVDRLWAEGYVEVAAALSGLVGRPVTVEVRLPDGQGISASGEVVFVSPEVEPANSQSRVVAQIDNTELLLRPGLRAVLTIHPPGERATAAAP
ncbi:HlyD family efflux transporter periplasmic adaptor subunit [Botrimarina sp.]|uniref:efflux RND transporter periplasmic adaptor subunit n=1 Tax=Botrimarina sp. TaxID=2795802 RepID=UPI0032EF2633